jgi:glucose/arabinose dehydrogenase
MFYSDKQFPAHCSDGPFVGFHGSWNRSREEQTGYNVTFQPFTKGKPSRVISRYSPAGFRAGHP